MQYNGLLQPYYRISPVNKSEENLSEFTPLMLSGVLQKINQARQADKDGNCRAFGFFIGRASSIIDALRDDLDLLHGGLTTQQYDSFYSQLGFFLEQSVAENDNQYLEKAENIIGQIANWWQSPELDSMPVQGNA